MERHAMKHANGSPTEGSSNAPMASGNDTANGKTKKMMPKRKEKEGELVYKQSKSEFLQTEQEIFLQAFERIFDKKNGATRITTDAVDGAFDDEPEGQKFSSRRYGLVETFLLKISHNKRKDISSTLKQVSFGKTDVLINPKADQTTTRDFDDKPPVVHIPTESFRYLCTPNHVAGPQLSILLLFRVHLKVSPTATNGNGFCDAAGNGHIKAEPSSDGEEPSAKRQKLHTITKLLTGELNIWGKEGPIKLQEGDYELKLREMVPQQRSFVAKNNSQPRNWNSEGIEMMDYEQSDDCSNTSRNDEQAEQELKDYFEEFRKHPRLKFRVQWTKDSECGVAELSAVGNGCSDKENYKPPSSPSESFKKGLNININNNSILTPAAASGRLNEVEQDQSSSDGSDLPPNNVQFQPDSNALVPTSSSSIGGEGRISDIAGLENGHEVKRVIYQLIHNNYTRQQTETTKFTCPWCSLNCCILYSLLKHLKLCHARFVFNFVPIANGARIDVSINELYDGSYNGSPHDLLGPTIGYTRRGPVRRTVVTNLLVCRPRRQKPSLSEFIDTDENEFDSQRPYITGHSRMYHHTMTCLPVYPRELDIDSEGESDPLWLQHKTMQMIDEFTDVNEGEKELMKMWNLHVMKYGYVGDCQIPIALEMFIDMRGRELWARNLYRNFVLHMSSMFDFGLVSADVMQRTIRKLRKILLNDAELQQQIRQSREQQMSYWNNVTVHKQAQKTEARNGVGERTLGAGASSSSGSSLASYHKAVHGGSNSGPASAGDGQQRKVKPTITPAKNTDPSGGYTFRF
ncbi:hypothetical protein ZHAS_00018140 [Anopheles sinensis]|uniref:VEFS-Box domain-containing protein n=1 Tax=Anopheles sinensis TaxID=74873 RepID=A0A084WIP4_ANOSI|nr:hypothetical protein ZHAS_00018140 [Anopheles sinensis]